jgi:predicted nucleic acid-binding protein
VKNGYLLDVNVLVALLWDTHSLHAHANRWFMREKPEVLGCAFTELSFLRISMADKTIAAGFDDASQAFADFTNALGRRYHYITSLPPPGSLPQALIVNQKEISDWYLCELAKAHSVPLATLDTGIKHPHAVLVNPL